MRSFTTLIIFLLLITPGCGGEESSNAASSTADADPAPTVPAGDPATLPKVPADEGKIAAMLRERFGEAVARTIRVDVEDKPEGLRVGLTGEVPTNEIRVAVMNEVEARVQNIKIQDFNLEIAGPVRMLFSFGARVRDREYTYFAPDLSFAVTKEGSVYETATGRRINRINIGDLSTTVYIELSNDGKTLAVSYRGGEIALFDMPLGRNRRTFQRAVPVTSFDDPVALAFSPDDTQLITINRTNGDLRVWDLAQGSAKQIGSHVNPNAPRTLGDYYYIAMSPDQKTIATASGDLDELFLWDAASRSKLETPKIDRLDPKALVWSHDGKTLAVARTTDEKRGVGLYDVASKEFRKLSTEQDELIRAMTFSPDDKTLAVSYESVESTVRLWDVAAGAVWHTLDDKKVGQPTSLAFSPDGAVLATDCPGLRPPAIRLWDVSKRPGATGTVPRLPRAYPEQIAQDDRLAAEIERRIRGAVDSRTIDTLHVEVQADGSIKLTGKVSTNENKRVAQLEAEVYHASKDTGTRERNKVINELEVTGKYGDMKIPQPR